MSESNASNSKNDSSDEDSNNVSSKRLMMSPTNNAHLSPIDVLDPRSFNRFPEFDNSNDEPALNVREADGEQNLVSLKKKDLNKSLGIIPIK